MRNSAHVHSIEKGEQRETGGHSSCADFKKKIDESGKHQQPEVMTRGECRVGGFGMQGMRGSVVACERNG